MQKKKKKKKKKRNIAFVSYQFDLELQCMQQIRVYYALSSSSPKVWNQKSFDWSIILKNKGRTKGPNNNNKKKKKKRRKRKIVMN